MLLLVLKEIKEELKRIADILDEVKSPEFDDRDASIRIKNVGN